MENGYQRPNWVTLEAGGVNANSSLPRYPEAYDDVDLATLGEGPATVGQITPFHTAHMMAYFTAVILAWPLFRQYRYPYTLKIWPQAWGHLRRYLIWLVRRRARETEAAQILEDPRPFFLACLQREGDTQLLRHSDVKTNRAFMAKVIRSFAAHAPSDARLVIKNHPLDPGVDDLPGVVQGVWPGRTGWRLMAGEVPGCSCLRASLRAHVAAGVVTVNVHRRPGGARFRSAGEAAGTRPLRHRGPHRSPGPGRFLERPQAARRRPAGPLPPPPQPPHPSLGQLPQPPRPNLAPPTA